MKIKIVGAGWFGCHLAASLKDFPLYEVHLYDKSNTIFSGASGNIPARLHLGAPHYPRSMITQQACDNHREDFMKHYGHTTRGVECNIYAIAKDNSLIDFGTYSLVLKNQIEMLTIHEPSEYGLQNVEGAVMIGERHIVVQKAKEHFEKELSNNIHLHLGSDEDPWEDKGYDLVIDCTFCASDNLRVDRFEPCIVPQLKGPTWKAVTIMDGPFPSLYPWNEEKNLSSLSSAKWSPLSKECKTYEEAKNLLETYNEEDLKERAHNMIDSMAHFYPKVKEYELIDVMTSIRAMPLSAADTRLVDVVRLSDKLIRIRSGKIDAVIEAERTVKEMINE